MVSFGIPYGTEYLGYPKRGHNFDNQPFTILKLAVWPAKFNLGLHLMIAGLFFPAFNRTVFHRLL